MQEKVAMFAFNGDPMCFVHVLLNALDLDEKGSEVKLVIEGSATKLVETLTDPAQPFAGLYEQVKHAGLVDCVCKACASKMGTVESAKAQALPLCAEMSGHPSIGRYLADGYTILTF